ncbi:MAG: dTDP-4-dehydrorhamnose reductase [Candidatus Accumulibacter sp.]|nr:dTDP-4-dehydrorhamnose reductase [Accumulibacter sp.]
MRILLFGKHGQLGWELQRSLAPLGELIALGREGSGDLGGDLTDLAGLASSVRRVAPAVIVNAAAYTAVDQAEAEPELAWQVNAAAPAVLADEARKLNAWLIHYSTDYVFDGRGHVPWREDDATAPLSVYGQSKRAGELAVADCPQHLILRTAWVFAAHGRNFMRTILRLARERDRLEVVSDQFGAPTGAQLIADVTAHLLRTLVCRPERAATLAGIYHLVASGETNWHEYACRVIDRARRAGQPIRVATDGVIPIAGSAYPLPAPRPANSRLATDKLRDAFALCLPDWRIGVDRLLHEMFEC